jgi:hypothetical protein
LPKNHSAFETVAFSAKIELVKDEAEPELKISNG